MIWGYAAFAGAVVALPAIGLWRGQPVIDHFKSGLTDTVQILFRLFPYVLCMLTAITMLRASGAFELLIGWMAPALTALGIPIDIVPLALVRPFSGSASNAVFADIIHTHGGNAYVSAVAATMLGSTETTFYILAIYFGSVGIRRIRYAVWAGLFADLAGVLAACFFCHYLL
jgi:spore maturation protein B